MWPFHTKKSIIRSQVLQGFTDWHCHLLPGVDDGVQEMEETLKILSLYEAQGIREVWLTPHIMEDIPNTPAELKDRFAELQACYQGKIQLHLAAENMLDNLFEKRLEKGELLPLGNEGKLLLVETSYFNPPVDFHRLMEGIKEQGFNPLLAHPERYNYMEDEDYDELWENGILFQLNIFSLVGGYGPLVRKKAQMLLQKGYYHLCGTDTHRLHAFSSLIEMPSLKSNTIEQLRMVIK